MTSSQKLFYFCFSFIGGVFVASFFFVPELLLQILLVLGTFLILLFWSSKKVAVAGFCVLFLALGVWRYQIAELQSEKSELNAFNDTEQTITLVGIVAREPDVREKITRLTIRTPKGKVLVTTFRYPEYKYGDKLKITGKLESPPVFSDFNYNDYLKKDGVFYQMSWPKIELLGRNQGNFLYAAILRFKNKLRESLYQNLSPPQSSILGAMILGDKTQLSDELKNKLNIAGVRHITAVSGLHIAILSAMIMTILLGLGLWRQHAFWLSIILITFFVIMTGFQPSAIRAAIMAGFFLTAQRLGRLNTSWRAIVFAAALMLLYNPLLLRLDVSFQLSFLAMLGIIYLLPTFQDWLKFIPHNETKSILAMTFSAYVFTLPLIVYNFGYISLVAPLTNLLIAPFLYPIMLLGFLAGLAGILFSLLGWILSWPLWFLLTYLISVVGFFSQPPFVYLTIEDIHWLWPAFSYLVLGLTVWRLRERQKLKFLQY